MTTRFCLFLLASMLLIHGPLPSVAQGSSPPSKEELQTRFKNRDPVIKKLKKDGKIGETYEGLISVTLPIYESDAEIRDTIAAENSDRRALYELLAAEQTRAAGGKTTVTAAMVAAVNASRTFGSAQPDESIQPAPETWIKKRDEPRYRLLERYKREGKVGETAHGHIEAVKPEFLNDGNLKRCVEEENASRRHQDEVAAKERKMSVEKIAAERGGAMVRRAPSGEYVKDSSGWKRK